MSIVSRGPSPINPGHQASPPSKPTPLGGLRPNLIAALLAFIALLPVPAAALDFGGFSAIYAETYVGEFASPTSPELDVRGLGGMYGESVPSGVDAPTLNGTTAHVSILSTDTHAIELMRVYAPLGTLNSSIALSAEFSNLTITGGGDVSPGIGAFYDTLPDQAIVPAYLIITNSDATLWIEQTSSFSALLAIDDTALPAAEAAAIVGGTAFTIDLSIDALGSMAYASVEVDGFPTPTTASITLQNDAPLGGTGTIASISQNVYRSNSPPTSVEIDLSSFSSLLSSSLIGDEILIQQSSTSLGTIRSDWVFVVEGAPEVFCPGAFDLCGANIPGLTHGNFDVEADTLTLNVGPDGGTSNFITEPFVGYIFNNLHLGEFDITGVELETDIPGLTPDRITFTENSVSVNFASLTVDPGQSLTVALNPPPPGPYIPSVPSLSSWGALALSLALVASVQFARGRARERHSAGS